ncbi:MAG: helix-turn-helix domain-containing protein [Prevotellaceae bacterium]|jgi:AraC-like DNA-binding protein|nr:helix-turn-helix domain-containing protein [Prevotellaceae bacterium]
MKEVNEKQVMSTNYVDNNEVYVECIERSKRGELNIPESSKIRLFFIQKGSCSFFCAKQFDVLLESGKVVLVPPQNKCIINVRNNIQLLIVYLTIDLNFCNDFPFEALTEFSGKNKNIEQGDEQISLKVNKMISDYLKLMKQCLSNGMKSAEFFQMKQKELLYYFGKCYSKDELHRFFKPILTNDIAFSKAVYKICESINSVTAMAKEMNYSLSGFKKRFKRVFGQSAYKWLCQEKSKKLFHEITCSRKTFTQLSYDFGFSSPAHMNNFCRKMFGNTPGSLRSQKILK